MRRSAILASIVTAALLLGSFAGVRIDRAAGQGASFQGSQKGTQGPVSLHAGLVILRGRSNGTGNFTVSLATQDPGATVQNSFNNRYLLIDAIGAYNGAAATLLRQDGSYFLDIGQASGAYQLTMEQPSPSSVQPVAQTSFSGQKQQVTQFFSLAPGNYTVTATSDSNALRVRMYSIDDLGGAAVVSPSTGYYGDELIDATIPPGLMSVPITVQSLGTNPDGTPINGIFVFYVDPGLGNAGNWTLSVQ
jgi:hypothetical protein